RIGSAEANRVSCDARRVTASVTVFNSSKASTVAFEGWRRGTGVRLRRPARTDLIFGQLPVERHPGPIKRLCRLRLVPVGPLEGLDDARALRRRSPPVAAEQRLESRWQMAELQTPFGRVNEYRLDQVPKL